MKILYKLTALLLCFLSYVAIASPDIIEAKGYVSENQVMLGDQFVLTIDLNDTGSKYQPDLTELKQNFIVYSPSVSKNTSFINGDLTYKTQFRITMEPKALGDFLIPAIKLGPVKTIPIKIKVIKASKSAISSPSSPVFIENTLNTNSIYIDQGVIYSSKIYFSQNLNNADLTNPALPNADIKPIGKDQLSETIRSGIRYKVIERQFEITLKTAGDFVIGSPVLRAMIYTNQAKKINIRGDELNIKVKNKPASYKGEWLVSSDVRLVENNNLTLNKIYAGDPITRSISLQVASIKKELLPNIDFEYPKGLKFYPDQDELSEGVVNGVLYSQKNIKQAIIANKEGQLTLPEIKLPWWNSKTDSQEYATLPAITLNILPSKNIEPIVQADQGLPMTPVLKDAVINSPSKAVEPNIVVDEKAVMLWRVIAGIFAILFISMLFYHLNYRSKRKRSVKPRVGIQGSDLKYRDLKRILKNNKPHESYRALLSYLQSIEPKTKRIKQYCDFGRFNPLQVKQFIDLIDLLENSCTENLPLWDSKNLIEFLDKNLQRKDKAQNAKGKMDLNP